MANLPIEIQWNIIKFMRHPTAEMLEGAKAEYKAHITRMEYELDGWRPGPPWYLVDAYHEMTFEKYLRIEMRRRHGRNIFARLHPEFFEDSDDDSS